MGDEVKPVVSIATVEHARELAKCIRPADEAECIASGFPTALEALERGVRNSEEAWAIHFGGELGVVMGISRIDDGVVYIWCLTGNVIDRAHLAFWRVSKAIIDECRRRYGSLVCLVDERHLRAQAWLDRLGFSYMHTQVDSNSLQAFRAMSIGRS